ncbi:MAG: Inositol 2-dehydrogenase [Candidatus Heimdallarchaeota archaeon LC_2]|nr:MAG: Inositol 2-dehydrogenase [Candidatus Heimdallarchaeota archaeon LC_2]
MTIAVIGVGGWGKNHTRVLSQLRELQAICDTDATRSQEFGKIYGVNHYTSIDDLLANEDFSGVLICTPTVTHYDIASKFIHNGKHVFVEKPLTYDSKNGQALADLAIENKVTLTCGYIERFNPAVSNVKKYVKEKTYGDLLMLEFHRANRAPLHIKDVGIIFDTTVHDIDTALYLFDDLPEVVFARSGRIRHTHEDFATIMLGFKDNHAALISANWITPTRVRKFNAVLTEGIISSDFITQKIKIDTADGAYIPRNQIEEPLMLEIKNFLQAINNSSTILVSAQDAVNVTKIAEAALQSSKQGKPIDIQGLD